MRQIYILGNGFDLAHGLKTSYRDFLTWYLNNVWKYIQENQFSGIDFKDGLILIKRDRSVTGLTIESTVGTPSDFNKLINRFQKSATGLVFDQSEMLKAIIGKDGWADIEKEYYRQIVNLDISPPVQFGRYKDSFNHNIITINESLVTLKDELEKYFMEAVLPTLDSNESIAPLEEIFSKEEHRDINEERLYINFNYTETYKKKYWMSPYSNMQIINIHGSIGDAKNPIIFGYGDEMDSHFKNLENKDRNEYLTNMKSFGYFKTSNYKKILDFLDQKESYKVHIIGHSLGLSDRLLLNVIFEHKNCKAIEIHYYKPIAGVDNFKELTMNMSRHFNDKSAMRAKVLSHDESRPMN